MNSSQALPDSTSCKEIITIRVLDVACGRGMEPHTDSRTTFRTIGMS